MAGFGVYSFTATTGFLNNRTATLRAAQDSAGTLVSTFSFLIPSGSGTSLKLLFDVGSYDSSGIQQHFAKALTSISLSVGGVASATAPILNPKAVLGVAASPPPPPKPRSPVPKPSPSPSPKPSPTPKTPSPAKPRSPPPPRANSACAIGGVSYATCGSVSGADAPMKVFYLATASGTMKVAVK